MRYCQPEIINFIEYVDPFTVAKYLEITEVENKTESELMQLFLHPNSDILCMKIKNDNVSNEGFSLRTIESSYVNAKRLLKTTAQDVINPQRNHRGHADSKSLYFANNCKPHQVVSNNGDLVISIAIPLGNASRFSAESTNRTPRESFARDVNSKLICNINLIKQIIDENECPYYFWSEYNISSNFCDALANLSKLGSEIEFFMQWCPFTQNNPAAKSMKFSPDNYKFLRSISQKIKED